MKDLATILPLVIAMITIGGGFFVYVLQKRVDSKDRELERKRVLYTKYLRAISDEIGHSTEKESTKEIRFEIVRLRMEIVCFGSDKVVKSLGQVSDVRAKLARTSNSVENYKAVISELILAMRQDCFSETSLSLAEIKELIPFN